MPAALHFPDGVDPPRRLLMGSGPSNPEPRVLHAMAVAPPLPGAPAFDALVADVARGARAVFQASDGAAVAVAGASRAGLEAAVAGLLEPGDRVLVGAYGHFGELLCTLAERHGARVERVDAAWGCRVDVPEMVQRIQADPPRVVAIVHADTSTGILQPLAEIGQATRAAGALFLVDAVLSLGGCDVDMAGWHVDVAVSGLQKCLGGPPGLSLVGMSDRALDRLTQRARPVDSAYLDLSRLATGWAEIAATHGIASPSMLLAAREALGMVLREGLGRRWARHRRASDALRQGLAAMGLEVFADAAARVPMITLIRVPEGMDDAAVRAELLHTHGVEIMAAFGPLRGKVWRIGTMGTNARLASVLAVLSALETVLAGRGFSLRRGAAVDAALAAGGVDAA